MNETENFCRIIRQRSAENAVAMGRVHDLPGIMASIIRQELDSLIRAFYLLSFDNINERKKLVSQIICGEKWSSVAINGKRQLVTDREMVNLLSKLYGWTDLVYKFGCAFIHFSNFHDYSKINPFENISASEKKDILSYLRQYHGGPQTDTPSFDELSSYFPKVFDKITENLEFYLEQIGSDQILEDL